MRCIASFSPSWRGVQLLTLASVTLCLLVLYTATWGRSETGLPDALTHLFPTDWGKHHATADVQVDTSGNHGVDPRPGDDAGAVAGTTQTEKEQHPITRLMRTAQAQFDALLAERPVSVVDAGRKYRERRGRHPPPWFDAWYAYAERKKAFVPEAFFDQVYHDLGPFWGVDVSALRRAVRGFSTKVRVRNGSVESSVEESGEDMRGLVVMLEELGQEGVMLPDMDIPVNVNEEVAMLVPWETMETAFEFARAFAPEPSNVVDTFSPLDEDDVREDAFDPDWIGDGLRHKTGGPHLGPRPLWSLVKPACPPDSVARTSEVMVDIWHPQGHTKSGHEVAALLPFDPPTNSSEGYVGNWTVAGDVCDRPGLQGLHGTFVAPMAMSITQKFFPLFSASKMGVSNEILIPNPIFDISERAVPVLPWTKKKTTLEWRGPASGGKNTRQNWRRMHRHRFVSMLNATHVEVAEGMLHAGNETTVGLGYAQNFRLLPGNAYHLDTQTGARMAEWVAEWADVGFSDLRCDEPTAVEGCEYNDEFFSILPEPETSKEDQSKYTAIVDGDGAQDHGDLAKHLLNGKVVLRASVYKQWFDARLIPWLHYVPLDHTFVDLYGIMEYFIGSSVASPAPEFPHAHVEVKTHEHHFQTPQWNKVEDGNVDKAEYKPVDRKKRLSNKDGAGSSHDGQAQTIAETGQRWASKALRKGDMLVYLYRLLLEYARILDEKRHTLGWVEY